ncbi:hypothetical protein ACS0TY_034074 [Phlomoides rotata]
MEEEFKKTITNVQFIHVEHSAFKNTQKSEYVVIRPIATTAHMGVVERQTFPKLSYFERKMKLRQEDIPKEKAAKGSIPPIVVGNAPIAASPLRQRNPDYEEIEFEWMKNLTDEGKQFYKDWNRLKNVYPGLSKIKSLTDRFHRYTDMVANNTLYSGLNAKKHRLDLEKKMNKPYSRRPQSLTPKELERRKRIEAEEQEKGFKMLQAYKTYSLPCFSLLDRGLLYRGLSFSVLDRGVLLSARSWCAVIMVSLSLCSIVVCCHHGLPFSLLDRGVLLTFTIGASNR